MKVVLSKFVVGYVFLSFTTLFSNVCSFTVLPLKTYKKHLFAQKSLLYAIEEPATHKDEAAESKNYFYDDDDYYYSVNNPAELRSITFSNIKRGQEPQLLCDFLMELGACSASITDADRGTDQEEAMFHEFDVSGSISQTAVTTHVWNNCQVTAHVPASMDLNWILEIVRETFPDLPNYTMASVDQDKDWVLHVQQSWHPIVIEPFVLRFPWHTDYKVQQELQKHNNDDYDYDEILNLKLQGGIAFGTGEHPTTKLCLSWIAKQFKRNSNSNLKLLDYGTGSGILGIAACALDNTVTAVGVDIDVDAVHIANANAEQNNSNMISYLSNLVQTNDGESKSILLRSFSSKKDMVADPLPDELNGPIYNVCVANILAGPLVSLVDVLAGLVQPGGKLGLSGILETQADMVMEAYSQSFEDIKVEQTLNEWVLITGTRRA